VIELALETAALMLGSDKARGYCLEMICADFLAGANLDPDSRNQEAFLLSLCRLAEGLGPAQKNEFLARLEKIS